MMKKVVVILCLNPFFCGFAQIVTKINPVTKKVENFEQMSSWSDGTPMIDSRVDNKFFYKIDNKYYKKVGYANSIPQFFGAVGDGVYNSKGDIVALQKASDDTQALGKFISSRKKANSTGSHFGGSSLYFPYSVYKTSGAYTIDDHYTNITGDGNGASIIHFLNNGKNQKVPAFTFGRKQTDNAYDSLLTGGGLENISLITDNSFIRDYAILMDYTEYMRFSNLDILGFGKSAVKGSFWEASFNTIKFGGCGTLQEADEKGNPLTGVIDSDSNSDNKYRDASNNTLFNKITFSSCAGTLIKLTSPKNTTVNMNINGLYAETYEGDSGKADELPLIYLKQAKNNSIMNGFITVNHTGVERNGTVIRLDELSDLSVASINILLNPVEGYLKRSKRRLRSFAEIAGSAVLNLSNVTISDPTDSVGFNLDFTPSFFAGNGTVNFNLLKVQILDYKSGGTRRITNIFDRKLNATGDLLLQPYDKNGAVVPLQKNIHFNSGKITVFADSIPENFETWNVGDKIEYKNLSKDNVLGKIVVSPGTTGTLENAFGSINKNSNELTVNGNLNLLPGDWLEIEGEEGYNRIAQITGRKIILENKNKNNLKNAKIAFHQPVWKSYGCIEK